MRTLVAALALAAVPGPSVAQTCFRPQPAPACRGFWILEVSTERRDGTLGGQALDSRVLGGSLAADLTAGPWRLGGPSPMAEVALEAAGVVGVSVGVRGDPLWPRRGEVYPGLRWSSYAAPFAVLAGVLKALSSLGGD